MFWNAALEAAFPAKLFNYSHHLLITIITQATSN